IRDRIPEYMVPSVVTMLDVLPVTSNGKVDRAALPEPAAATSREFVPPATATEQAVASSFTDVLQIEHVGRTDDFFDLGGHSLLAMRGPGRLIERCGRVVPVRLVFEHSRVDALAAAIDQLAERDDSARALTIAKAPR